MANQTECSRLEQRSVINYLVAEKYKLWEIYKIKCGVYEEACFSYKYLKMRETGELLRVLIEKYSACRGKILTLR